MIEPAFTVDYTTAIDNYQQTPILTDYSDLIIGGTSRLTCGLTNRLLYRSKAADGARGQTREFVTFGVQQAFYSNRQSSRCDTAYASSSVNRNPVDLSPVTLNVRVCRRPRGSTRTADSEYDVSGLGLAVWTIRQHDVGGPEFRHAQLQPSQIHTRVGSDTYFSGINVAQIAERSFHRHMRAELGHHAFDSRLSKHPGELHGTVLRSAGRFSEIQLPELLRISDTGGSPDQLLLRPGRTRDVLELLRRVRELGPVTL